MLLNSFSSYSSGSSDLSSVLGGVSVEELEKVKESKTTIKSVTTSYSSPQSAPLETVLDVSGSGVLLASIISSSRIGDDSISMMRVTIDGRVIFYCALTRLASYTYRYYLNMGVTANNLIKPSFSETFGQEYMAFLYGQSASTGTNYSLIDDELTSEAGNLVRVCDSPILFLNNLKVEAKVYNDNSENDLTCTTRYILKKNKKRRIRSKKGNK